MKTIIVYYSLDGNTKQAAETLAKAIGADVCEIQPVKPIKSAGKPTFRTIMQGGGQVAFGLCPALKEFSADLSQYDRIILGTPVWNAKCASFVRTFAKKYARQHNLTDKVTAVFTLSGGGDNTTVACDPVYGGAKQQFSCCEGQCLHAREIGFIHPRDGRSLYLTSELPEYFNAVLHKLALSVQ